ncbi:Penicillin-binding protein activator LpoB [Serratia symbiotica]|nr:Penicillin-binding protein activator LpoB [Serratia symbiotica]
MQKYSSVGLAILTLTGCSSPFPQSDTIASVMLPEMKEQSHPPDRELVPSQPKIQQFCWFRSLQPLVSQMVEAKGVTAGNMLLVETIQNNTNGTLQTAKATSALHTVLDSYSDFSVVPEPQLKSARQALGLSSEDSFGSRSKAIALARIVNAQYVLYSVFSGDVRTPTLDMQLILVKTREIIWSGNDIIQP